MREFDSRGSAAVGTGRGIDVKIVHSPTYRVALFADPVMAGTVLVGTSGSTLRIGRARRFSLPPWTLDRKARVEISMPAILPSTIVRGAEQSPLETRRSRD